MENQLGHFFYHLTSKNLEIKKGYFNLDCKYPYPKFNSKLEQPLKSQSDWEKGC